MLKQRICLCDGVICVIGSIEQDADIVDDLYRETYQDNRANKDDDDDDGGSEAIKR